MSNQEEIEYDIKIHKAVDEVDSLGMAETGSEEIVDRQLAIKLYRARIEELKQKIAAVRNASKTVRLEDCVKEKAGILDSMKFFKGLLLNKQEQIREKLKIADNVKAKLTKMGPEVKKKYSKRSKQMDKLLKKRNSKHMKSFRSLRNISLFN